MEWRTGHILLQKWPAFRPIGGGFFIAAIGTESMDRYGKIWKDMAGGHRRWTQYLSCKESNRNFLSPQFQYEKKTGLCGETSPNQKKKLLCPNTCRYSTRARNKFSCQCCIICVSSSLRGRAIFPSMLNKQKLLAKVPPEVREGKAGNM